MSKKRETPIRAISILVGIMVGCVLAYAYHVNMRTLVFEIYEMNLPSLVVFLTIPILAGFVAGLVHPDMAMLNGLYVGLFTGIVNAIMGTIKMLFIPVVPVEQAYAFAVFAVISVFLWMIVAAVGALLAKRFYE